MGFSVLVSSIAFLATFLGVFAINLLIGEAYERKQEKIRDQLEEIEHQRERRRIQETARLRQPNEGDQTLSLEELEKSASESGMGQRALSERLNAMVRQSGMTITVKGLLLGAFLSSMIPLLLFQLLFDNILLAVLLGLISGCVPFLVVSWKRVKRMNQLREQLPDGFDLMARVLRAGQSIQQAIKAVSDEFSEPIGVEFGICYEQQNLGLDPELALRDLTRRTGVLELQIFVMSLLVHRQVGGNLAELLDRLSHLIRERFRMQGKIKALTAEGRMQGIALLLLPILIWFLFLLLNPTYALELFQYPVLPIGALFLMGVGALAIRKIVNFDF